MDLVREVEERVEKMDEIEEGLVGGEEAGNY